MPGASSKPPQAAPQPVIGDVLQEPLKNALLIFERKQRNLEKRKLKLLETKKKAESGSELNDDQKNALQNLALVDNSLEVVRELHKMMSNLEQEYTKLARKEQKRAKQENRDQVEAKGRSVGLKIVQVQAILADMTEEVRPDFLAGANGACKLSEEELEHLDTIYELVNPAKEEGSDKKLSDRVSEAGEHLLLLVEGKDKDFSEGVTYKQVLDIINKIQESCFFDKDTPSEETPPAEEEEAIEETDETGEEVAPSYPEELEEPQQIEEDKEQPPEESNEIETTPVNGVDLPPDVQETPEDEKINFLVESEISPAAEQPGLNPISPEFVPRFQNEESGGWNETESGGWSELSQNSPQNGDNNFQQGGFRGRGRGGGGRGRGRGRGGFRGGRQDGYRESGGYRGGNRGGSRGDYRGGNRGDYRGGNRGNRGGPRGGGNRGAPRGGGGGFGKPSNQ